MFMVWTIDQALSERMQEHVVRANLHMQASSLLAGIERVLSSRFFGYSDTLSKPYAMLDVASKLERFILSVLKDYVCAYLPERAAVMYPGHAPAKPEQRIARFERLLQEYQSAMRSHREWGFEPVRIVRVENLSHSVLDRILTAEQLGMEVRVAEATLGFAAALPFQPTLTLAGIPLNFDTLNFGALTHRAGGDLSPDSSADVNVLMVVRTQQSREPYGTSRFSCSGSALTPYEEGQEVGSTVLSECARYNNAFLQPFSDHVGEQIASPKPEPAGDGLFARPAQWLKNHTR
jgi:hypothetical protein